RWFRWPPRRVMLVFSHKLTAVSSQLSVDGRHSCRLVPRFAGTLTHLPFFAAIAKTEGLAHRQYRVPSICHAPVLLASDLGYSEGVDEPQQTTLVYIGLLLGLAVGALALAWSRMTQVDADEI